MIKLTSAQRTARTEGDVPASTPIVSRHATRKATREARRTTLARKAQRAMKYGGK